MTTRTRLQRRPSTQDAVQVPAEAREFGPSPSTQATALPVQELSEEQAEHEAQASERQPGRDRRPGGYTVLPPGAPPPPVQRSTHVWIEPQQPRWQEGIGLPIQRQPDLGEQIRATLGKGMPAYRSDSLPVQRNGVAVLAPPEEEENELGVEDVPEDIPEELVANLPGQVNEAEEDIPEEIVGEVEQEEEDVEDPAQAEADAVNVRGAFEEAIGRRRRDSLSLVVGGLDEGGAPEVDAAVPEAPTPGLLKRIGTGIVSGAKAVGRGIVSGAKAIGRGIASGAKAIGSGVVSGAKAIGRGAQAIGREVVSEAQAIGSGIVSSAKTVGRGIVSGAKTVGRGIVSGAKAIGRGAQAIGRGVVSGARTVAGGVAWLAKGLWDGLKWLKNAGASLLSSVGTALASAVSGLFQTIQEQWRTGKLKKSIGTGLMTVGGLVGAAIKEFVTAAAHAMGPVNLAITTLTFIQNFRSMISSHRHFKRLEKLAKDVVAAGQQVDPELLKAVQFGVGQKKEKRGKKIAAVVGGAASITGGTIGAIAAFSAVAAAVPIVGWVVGGIGISIAVGLALWKLGRWIYKKTGSKPAKHNTGLVRQQAAQIIHDAALRVKLGDPHPDEKKLMSGVLKELKLTLDQAAGRDGVSMIANKLQSN